MCSCRRQVCRKCYVYHPYSVFFWWLHFPSSFPPCHSHQLLFFFAVSFQGCFNDKIFSRFEACSKLFVASRLQVFSSRAVSLRKTSGGSFVTSITLFFSRSYKVKLSLQNACLRLHHTAVSDWKRAVCSNSWSCNLQIVAAIWPMLAEWQSM